MLSHLPLPERIVLALDDTPTALRPRGEEGSHHNPTSGPDDHKFVYGHVWVTLAWVVRHPLWHTIGLPLLARLYVKAKNVPLLAQRYGWVFQTKLQLAVDFVQWAANTLKPLGKPIWLVMDGAYAYRPLLKPILAMGITVVSRLRKDAGLRTLPPRKRRGQRGKRKYGKEKISLAKRAAHPAGWQTIEAVLYGGQLVTKTYKTFLATWPVVGGVIRVVLVRESQGKWDAFFCTDPTATVRQILECYSDRSAIEQIFHDIKEIWGAGQQQVRNLWRNIGCFHLNLWMHSWWKCGPGIARRKKSATAAALRGTTLPVVRRMAIVARPRVTSGSKTNFGRSGKTQDTRRNSKPTGVPRPLGCLTCHVLIKCSRRERVRVRASRQKVFNFPSGGTGVCASVPVYPGP